MEKEINSIEQLEAMKEEGFEITRTTRLSLRQRLTQLPKLLWNFYRDRREQKKSERIGRFIHANKRFLIIIADPATDKLLMSYKDKVVINRIISADGYKHKVVKKILRKSTFENNIDRFIASLAESLKLRLADGNAFFQWVDGALFNISKFFDKAKNK